MIYKQKIQTHTLILIRSRFRLGICKQHVYLGLFPDSFKFQTLIKLRLIGSE